VCTGILNTADFLHRVCSDERKPSVAAIASPVSPPAAVPTAAATTDSSSGKAKSGEKTSQPQSATGSVDATPKQGEAVVNAAASQKANSSHS